MLHIEVTDFNEPTYTVHVDYKETFGPVYWIMANFAEEEISKTSDTNDTKPLPR
jgi:hypothetical protein